MLAGFLGGLAAVLTMLALIVGVCWLAWRWAAGFQG